VPVPETFEQMVVPHLQAGYNLARWLLRNDPDAEDVMQDATIRAFRHFAGFTGQSPRAWLLAVVRNCAYTFLQQRRARELNNELVEDRELPGPESPEVILLRSARLKMLNDAVDALPVEFREVFVLREMEGLSYKEIASVAGVPIGTVMSRLARARRRLETVVARREQAGSSS
jgi:RNA polymerase sigma-70 factor (ECF subfamily)